MWPVAAGSRAQRLAVGAASPWPRAAGHSSRRAPDDVLPAAPWPGPGALRWAFSHLLVRGMGCCRVGNRAALRYSRRVLGSGVKPMEGCDALVDLTAFAGLIPSILAAGAPLQRAEGVRGTLQPRERSGAPACRGTLCGRAVHGESREGIDLFCRQQLGEHPCCLQRLSAPASVAAPVLGFPIRMLPLSTRLGRKVSIPYRSVGLRRHGQGCTTHGSNWQP